jgi:putative component of toxin-antitoxin plasmid stabilization module
MLLILAQTIFADTLYLKDGNEIKDVKIVEIGVSEVKYKIGKKDVLYAVKKSDIAIIF